MPQLYSFDGVSQYITRIKLSHDCLIGLTYIIVTITLNSFNAPGFLWLNFNICELYRTENDRNGKSRPNVIYT